MMNPRPTTQAYRDDDNHINNDGFDNEEPFEAEAQVVRSTRRSRQCSRWTAIYGIAGIAVIALGIVLLTSLGTGSDSNNDGRFSMVNNNAPGETNDDGLPLPLNFPTPLPDSSVPSPSPNTTFTNATTLNIVTAEPNATSASTTTNPTTSTAEPSPTFAPTTASTPIILQEEVCLPDRFDNAEMTVMDETINIKRLYRGQFICSKASDGTRRYRFGMTLDTGDVIWEDMQTGERQVLYQNTANSADNTTSADSSMYFSLRIDGTMVLSWHDKNQPNPDPHWTAPPVTLQHPMSHTKLCLAQHDCPYLHLHSDGVMVLNYIAGDGAGWQARNFLRVYGF